LRLPCGSQEYGQWANVKIGGARKIQNAKNKTKKVNEIDYNPAGE